MEFDIFISFKEVNSNLSKGSRVNMVEKLQQLQKEVQSGQMSFVWHNGVEPMTHLLAAATYKWKRKDSSFLFIIYREERWVSGQAVDFLKVTRSTEIQSKLMEYNVWIKKKDDDLTELLNCL